MNEHFKDLAKCAHFLVSKGSRRDDTISACSKVYIAFGTCPYMQIHVIGTHQEHHHRYSNHFKSNNSAGIMFKNSIEDRSGNTAPVPGPIKGARLAV